MVGMRCSIPSTIDEISSVILTLQVPILMGWREIFAQHNIKSLQEDFIVIFAQHRLCLCVCFIEREECVKIEDLKIDKWKEDVKVKF